MCSSNADDGEANATKSEPKRHGRRPEVSSHAAAVTPSLDSTATRPAKQFKTRRRHVASIAGPALVHLCHFVLLGLLVLSSCSLRSASADWLMDCGDCHCKWQSGKKTADCKNLSMVGVPENLSPEVQVLDLSLNRIAILEQNAFLNAQLDNLHKLFIRNSSLQQIDPRTFTQLEILIELDLSNNLLRALQANVFVRLVKVRAIVLNGNLLESLGDGVFQNLKYLHKVELKHNRLVRVAPKVFANVPLLAQIYMDGNRLSFLRKESFESVERLTALSLDQNPWNCTCELQIFRDFVLKRNLYTPPTACYYPAHLRGMLWVEDQPEAFACRPRIIYPARGASINTSKENVTLVCRVHASPNTLIAWDYNKQRFRNSNSRAAVEVSSGYGHIAVAGLAQQQQRVHIELLRDEHSAEKEFGRDVFVSRLTILRAEKSDEGIYTCLAENGGGKDSVQMSLLLQQPAARDLLLQSNLAIVIALMALGLLSVSVFLTLLTCCIYKRIKAGNPNQHQHHHHHLDTSGQMCGASDMTAHQTTTTAVDGGTNVVLGGEGAKVTDSLKQHQPKCGGVNGGINVGEGETARNKYAELTMKHGALENGHSSAGVAGGLFRAEKSYRDTADEDTLHIKYPHGMTNRHTITTSTTKGDSSAGRAGAASRASSRHHVDIPNGLALNAARGGELLLEGRVGEFQPDLLPSYDNKTHIVAQRHEQAGLSTPVKATPTTPPTAMATINQLDDQQLQLKRSKYNSGTQQYLQARYSGVGVGGGGGDGGAGDGSDGICKPKSTRTLRRNPPLSSSSTTTTSPLTEFGLATLQRPTKSFAVYGEREYRQPPPPPYTAAHRTSAGLQRRTSGATATTSMAMATLTPDSVDSTSGTKDQGYREAAACDGVAPTRQTIVTASTSLNFLTTTGYPPQRQLL